MALYNPTKDQVRQFFFDTWAKYKQQAPLTDLEKIALQVIQMHPEYHTVLDSPERHQHVQYFPEKGETNPFLHMSLHLSVIEQININQPLTIKAVYDSLLKKHQDMHLAQHYIVECLAETIWQSQRNSTPLDSAHYTMLLQEKVR